MNQMRVIFHFRCNSLIKPICLQEPTTTTFMFYYFFAIQTKVDSMAGAKAIRNQYFFYKRLLAGEKRWRAFYFKLTADKNILNQLVE